MGFREVTMEEVKEVLLLWLGGAAKKRIARQLRLSPNTVRRYVVLAEQQGLKPEQGKAALGEEQLAAVLSQLQGPAGRPHGEAWARCEAHRERIAALLEQRLKLTKVQRLLAREGVQVPYPTLHRFCMRELGLGRAGPTLPVADCGPGEEVQVDTGWMTLLEADEQGRRRRFRAWIFTAVLSRHRFVWPVFEETTASAIEACEAAWEFFGGVFRTVVVDNTKAVVTKADALGARLSTAFLEYAQERGFHVDTTRVRSPKDKARVERAVQPVRDDCFAGERLASLEQARARAAVWCKEEYGRRRHTRTGRMPLEHFEAQEKPALLPAPQAPYEVPLWSEPLVARDGRAQVARALYSLPVQYVGQRLRARADRTLVRFYDGHQLVKTHPRQPPGGHSTDASDYPAQKAAYAMRDVAFLEREATRYGASIGAYARALLDSPLPWTRMRQVYALLGLVKRYGPERLEQTCATALAAQLHDVRRLERMVRLAAPSAPATQAAPANVIPLARFLRPASHYALPAASRGQAPEGEET